MTIFPKYFFCLLVLGSFSTCITPLDVEPSEFEDLLVVQGFITDDYGPHNIRISRIVEFTGVQEGGIITIEEDASVRIIDQNGESTKLERVDTLRREKRQVTCDIAFVPVKTDYRTTASFRGVIGSTYTLEIVTKNGNVYQSNPQKILSTPAIDSLSVAFKELPGLDPVIPDGAIEVSVTWMDPVEQENFYFWRLNGIYRVYTPDRSTPNFCCAYDSRDGGSEDCWIVEKNVNGNELAFSDVRVNGQKITLPVGIVLDNAFRFANQLVSAQKQYYVEVEQFNINRSAFEFNERIKTLNNINGEIFDAPPLSVRGNLFNVDDPNESVIGYFGAFAKQSKGRFVQRSQLKFIKRFPDLCGDCRILPGAQLEIPEPYKN